MLKNIIIGVLIILVGIFAWWTISPLFIDVEVNDELPTGASNITVEEEVTMLPSPEQEQTENEISDEAEEIQEEELVERERLYPIIDTRGHPATGNVRVVLTPEEKIVRYENYEGTNGPDLKIYLAKDLDAEEFIDLGPSRANKGNINYSVPLNIDVDEYKYVLTWCEAFGVLFDYAEIN